MNAAASGTPSPSAPRGRRTLRAVVIALAALAAWFASTPLDPLAHRWLAVGKSVERHDWYQALRAVGYFPAWLVVALLLHAALVFRGRRAAPRAPLPATGGGVPDAWRGPLVVLSAAGAGAAASLLKSVLGRSRPDDAGLTTWHGLLAGFREGHPPMGLPSGHTATAFGGCVALALLWPGLRWPALALAAACGVTRLAAGAHTLSDITAAAALASVFAYALHRAARRTAPRLPSA